MKETSSFSEIYVERLIVEILILGVPIVIILCIDDGGYRIELLDFLYGFIIIIVWPHTEDDSAWIWDGVVQQPFLPDECLVTKTARGGILLI